MKPEVYSIRKSRSGWKLSRRDLAGAAAVCSAAAILGCGPAPPCHGVVAHSDRVESLAFSKDGKLLASGSWDKTVKLW